ncbi:MAG: hypothetical protein RIT43_888 [Bacteroidota bacterium]|jgi:hypothetical protein
MKTKFYSILLIFAALSSCAKYEGTGGRSSISGKIRIQQRLFINGTFVDSVAFDGAKEDVFILYGSDDTAVDDKVECSHDGSFKFDYLQPGTYTIFGYNEIFHTGPDQNNNDDDYYTNEAVSITVELGKNEQRDLGTITLVK